MLVFLPANDPSASMIGPRMALLAFLERDAEMARETLHIAPFKGDDRVGATIAGTFFAVVHGLSETIL
jgi:hypothetical protein